MPQKTLPYTNPLHDGRRKILPSQYPEIREQYKALKSQRKVAKLFNCSRRLITFILYPERLQQLQEHKKKIKAHLKYYNKELHTKAIAKYRAKKRAHNLIIRKTKQTPCNQSTGKKSQHNKNVRKQ